MFPVRGVDGADNVVLVGTSTGTIDFGGGPLTTTGPTALVLAKFDGAGAHLWSQSASSTGVTPLMVVAAPTTGDLVVAGGLGGIVDLGGGPLTTAGQNDALVAAMAP